MPVIPFPSDEEREKELMRDVAYGCITPEMRAQWRAADPNFIPKPTLPFERDAGKRWEARWARRHEESQ